MPLQNRVTPAGELIAHPARGLVYGNRGCLHDVSGRIRRRYNGKRWIACRLEFRGWQRGPLLQPGRFNRAVLPRRSDRACSRASPCALCRREDYNRLVAIWSELHPGQVGADAIDAQLHAERVASSSRTQRHHEAALDELPDGAFVLRDDEPYLVLGTSLLRWSPARYATRDPRTTGSRTVLITPPSLVAVLRAGWQPLVPLIHPSAFAA